MMKFSCSKRNVFRFERLDTLLQRRKLQREFLLKDGRNRMRKHFFIGHCFSPSWQLPTVQWLPQPHDPRDHTCARRTR